MNDPHRYLTVACGTCGHTVNVPESCGNRFCPVCNRSRLARMKHKLTRLLAMAPKRRGESLKFITLTTVKHSDARTGVKRLMKSFRRLRQRAFWRNHFSGGAYVIEITGTADKWHCHLHIIAYGTFCPVRKLSRAWKSCDGGYIVWISRPPQGAAVSYLTSYVSKSTAPEGCERHLSEALKGTRLFQPFGMWQNTATRLPKFRMQCPVCHSTVWCMIALPRYLDIPDPYAKPG